MRSAPTYYLLVATALCRRTCRIAAKQLAEIRSQNEGEPPAKGGAFSLGRGILNARRIASSHAHGPLPASVRPNRTSGPRDGLWQPARDRLRLRAASRAARGARGDHLDDRANP